MTGVAEAGEVDRRIQIPADRRASVAATIDAITQRELGFHPAVRAQLSRRKQPGRGHQRGAIPTALVIELGTDPPQRSVAEGAVEAAFTATTAPAHVVDGELFDRDDLVAGRQLGGGLVDHVGADGRHLGMNPAHPGVGALPAFRRLPPRLRVGVIGAQPARGLPVRRPQPRCACVNGFGAEIRSTSTLSGVATTSRSLTPTSAPTTGCADRPAWAGRVLPSTIPDRTVNKRHHTHEHTR